SANDLIDKTAVAVQVIEVSTATQQQRILQGFLEMAVRALDRTILVCDTQIVARRYHAVMAHEFLIALRQVFLSVAIHVAERRRETVTAMLAGNATKPPQRVLQPLC